MKKTIVTILIGLLFISTKAYALKFSKCYAIDGPNAATKFEDDKFEKWEYEPVGTGVQEKIIYTDSFLKEINRKHDEFIKKEREKGHNTRHSYREKIETRYFELDFFDEKYMRVKEQDYSGPTTIIYQKTFDLSTGEVSSKTIFKYIVGKNIADGLTIKCSISESKRSSSYLDYWWALILILAVTFFIYTQSGKQLDTD